MLSIEEIKKELTKRKDKISYLKEQLAKTEVNKSEIRGLLIEAIKEKNIVKTGATKHPIKYRLVYDSMGEGIEPVYFWILDLMRDRFQGLGLDVSKTGEDFEASVSGGYFAEMGARATRMQEQAMKMLGTINAVVRSILNIIYDLRDFEVRLETYEKSHSKDLNERETAILGLKQLWMDRVDVNRGAGAINMLARQLQFVTLRDAFMAARSAEDVDKIDLNDRVKRILKPRVQEFLEWKDRSEKELKKRYNIERAYLRSQVAGLKLYSIWTKPYLKAAQKLGMKDFNSPDVVNVFNTMQMELALFGKKEITPAGVNPAFEDVKLEKKYYACVEVVFRFRALPQIVRGGGGEGSHVVYGGRTELEFRPLVLTNDELETLKQQELYEGMDLIEDMIDVPLKEIREDIEKYLKSEEEKEEEKKKKAKRAGASEPFTALVDGFKLLGRAFKVRLFKKPEGFVASEVRTAAVASSRGMCFTLYDTYKKGHGMPTW